MLELRSQITHVFHKAFRAKIERPSLVNNFPQFHFTATHEVLKLTEILRKIAGQSGYPTF